MVKPNAAQLFRQHFSEPAIAQTYTSRVSSSRAIGLDRIDARNFSARAQGEIALISKKVLAGTYTFTKYKEKLVSRGAVKAPRRLSIPTIRDRVTLRVLCDFLFYIFPEARPELPQAKIDKLKDAVDSGSYKSFIRIDLRDFYPSIRQDMLLSKLQMRARLPQFKQLMKGALRNPTVPENETGIYVQPDRGVAQGLSVSNVLAEIFMLDVDKKFQALVPIYLRYVDDIIILTNSDPKAQCSQVLKILEQARLDPHPLDTPESKTHLGSVADGFNYLGYSIRPKKVSVKKASVLGFETSLVEAFTEYKHKLRRATTSADRDSALARFRWALNLKLTGCIYMSQRFGWVFYYSQINDLSVLRRIDNTVEALLRRFSIKVPPKPKRALKSFYESKRVDKSSHQYIPNYDNLSPTMMRKFFLEIGMNVQGFPDDEVVIAFNRLLRRATHKLQKDVASIS